MTRVPLIMLSTAAALALAGCEKKTEVPVSDNVNTANFTVDDDAGKISPGQTFANKVAAGNAFEIAAANLAKQKSETSAIQAFATQMVSVHNEQTTQLMAAASRASPAIIPQATLNSEQQAKLTALEGLTGSTFDRAFAAEQVAAHQGMLDTLQQYSGSADLPQLKEFADSSMPIVTAHLNMAKALKP